MALFYLFHCPPQRKFAQRSTRWTLFIYFHDFRKIWVSIDHATLPKMPRRQKTDDFTSDDKMLFHCIQCCVISPKTEKILTKKKDLQKGKKCLSPFNKWRGFSFIWYFALKVSEKRKKKAFTIFYDDHFSGHWCVDGRLHRLRLCGPGRVYIRQLFVA